ncbi:replicative superfamily II helicase [Humibacillus xanthopallidus]|uniref:Replicative superfamily II helicase n=1 Tax=Humibacillus xanthopallidus TaxID=412689 RepID=A0A543PKR1_9MICO|nr:DEAD/DEAH box helicase [Humibacillus xanthopallidus]TQN44665.1 replicative superfamily II helicase [Humibacillus xanthopallidus]
MRQLLRTWIADADTRQSLEQYRLPAQIVGLDYQDGRSFDLFLSLVGELFDLLRDAPADSRDWATLGNALSQLAGGLEGNAQLDATFYSAAAFYSGGYSASAYVAMRQVPGDGWQQDTYRACYDFLARPARAGSERVQRLLQAVITGDLDSIELARIAAEGAAAAALEEDPDTWVAERVYAALMERFSRTNVRAVLPDGASEKWTPLVGSLMNRPRPVWDFFPSQIAAIEAGLLSSEASYAMEMPTGAGKTALTETLLFNHLIDRPADLAVLLVPYRALARELRGSVARRLSRVGLNTRTVYGGTVPTYDEAQGLDDLRAIIATPEALTGLLGSAPELVRRISLVVCDEGHLLDQPGRGVGLELLLARLLGREGSRLRTVFVSAIVPNIEEINAWLGGSEGSVVRSDFRPAEAEYAVLRPRGSGRATRVGLQMQAVDTNLEAHTLPDFLQVSDFQFTNPTTLRPNTYNFSSVKTQAIAAARKSLVLGTVAVFSATKTGAQGVVGLAEELLKQLDSDVPLPRPIDAVEDQTAIELVSDYLGREFGPGWVGTQSLRAGVVVHHGDIPQETREAVEELLSDGKIRLVLCTGTLAEGINLPIRTLVLYAVQRRTRTGMPIPMLARDIRNLVGRAGRAGSSTKGLVIVANPNQWRAVEPVATGRPGEDVHGALRALVEALRNAISRGTRLSNDLLEGAAGLFPLTDGVDSTLLELLHDEIGDEEFRELAAALASHTFAAKQLDPSGQQLLARVFAMRADRLASLRTSGRIGWVRETGARARLVDSVVDDLVPLLDNWDSVETPRDPFLIDAVLAWAYRQPDFREDLREAFPDAEFVPPDNLPEPVSVRDFVVRWINGDSFADIATATGRTVDEVLRIYGSVISYSLATLVEQAVAVLQRYFADTERGVAEAVVLLPEYLRFGVPTRAARDLMVVGVRHRRAAVLLGQHPAMTSFENVLREARDVARDVITTEDVWLDALGQFVYERTRVDLGQPGSNDDDPDSGGPDQGSDGGPGQGPYPPTATGRASVTVPPAPNSTDDGWEEFQLDEAEREVVDHIRALTGNALETADSERVVRGLLELLVDDSSIARILDDLGDVIVTAVRAAPTGFPLIDSGTVYEYDYGLRLDEVVVEFEADLDIGLSPGSAHDYADVLGGRIVYGDDDWASVLVPVRLRCTAQVRAEFEAAEITEVVISLSDDW